MSGKGTHGSSNGTTAPPDRPEKIRNVALVGRSGAGKTMLSEALLVATGTINRMGSILDGTTVSDSDSSEIHQQRSVTLSVLPLVVDQVKVNLLDTPGYADFVGELRAGLRAADAALFVVSAVDGVDAATSALWAECESIGMPRGVVISRIDHPRARYETVLTELQRAFGSSVVPVYVPIHTAGGITGLLGLLSGTVSDYSAGTPRPARRQANDVERADSESARAVLIEGIIAESEDETLMDRYLGGEEIPLDTLIADVEIAVARGSFFPVLAASAETGVGVAEVLDLLTGAFPSPVERGVPAVAELDGRPIETLACDPAGPLLGGVVRTTIDSFLGRVCLVRVFSGTIREDSTVHIGGSGLVDRGRTDHDSDERVTHLQFPMGSSLSPAPYCVAGDICALTRMSSAETGDTVSAPERPMLVTPWEMPEPLMPVAVQAATHGDEDALARSLAKVAAVDPTLRVERNAETHQLILWCMGEAHAEVVLDRLRGQGVKVQTVGVITPLRETFARPIAARGRYVKQSGGHGQYAICDIEVEPLERGAGFEFVDKVVGGVVPNQYIGSVERGVRAQMQKGVSAGYPVVDIRVRLVGGKAHSVDSSDAAFQAAGALALREAAAASRIQLLEPVSAVTINVPDSYVGTVMTDLSTRRGHLTGVTSVGEERSEVTVEIPDAELLRYAMDLRALTAGSGRFRRAYLRHEPAPLNVAADSVTL
ncbi:MULTISPECIES: elongation factor G-like protein EF-G2 [unclassified Cryobacterium]|uniref:elongation factor G-like protein EF-G2 n=1 Tax=unclassified Cryobacterium TaxID=2649013 RepID=UPI00106CA632|nr:MULTISPECIES: elongation factor G-like protein EF-G2 [unclassified Cryobacterium]TFC00941.1 elongation factor G-like protein EF-G2 [Cryobacterium sp. MDB2-A-1]TFC13121.1 elongation factor G-like protein EF-G2 [Cryobacterium sp. MDB2-A-2]TFC23931.1 elongation factor G-like protein EF-G2 [Cryobacterium sp. MDB2-10]